MHSEEAQALRGEPAERDALTAERPYRFPPNRRAERLKLLEQIEYIRGEVEEARRALLMGEGDSRVIEELWDVIQTAEGGLRKFPRWRVKVGLARVKLKSLMRGDYGGR